MARLIVFLLASVFSVSAISGDRLTGLRIQYRSQIFQQEPEEKQRLIDRLTFGGNIGLQIGNPTNILISPAVGYILPGKLFQDRFVVGLGITYMYTRIRYLGFNYESNVYGGRTFARYLIFRNIFAYTEHEFLNTPNYYRMDDKREWVHSLYLGGGYLLQFSRKGGIMIYALYNVLWTPLHPIYTSPFDIRVGFMF